MGLTRDKAVLINGEDMSQFITDFQYVHGLDGHRYEFHFVVPAYYVGDDSGWNRVKIVTPGGKRLDMLRKAVGEWMRATAERDECMFREDWDLMRACQVFLEEGGQFD